MDFWHSLRYLMKSYLSCINPFGVFVLFCMSILGLIYFDNRIHIKKTSMIWIVMIAMYTTLLMSVTLLGREVGSVINNFPKSLFSTYWVLLDGIEPCEIYEILYNVILFIPSGTILCTEINSKKGVIIVGFCISLIIELIQVLLKIGLFEVCDLIDNTMGVGIGVLLFQCYISIVHRRK